MDEVALKPGHSLAVVKENMHRLLESGKSEPQARAIAFRHARQSLADRFSDGVEVFRAGNYPGKLPVSEADVRSIADTYNRHQAGRGARYEAAAKFTHDIGRPAEGWVKELTARGRSLVARFRDVSEDLLNSIIEERYPNPSIELRQSFMAGGRDQGLSLKSVAFLGADPPAVKELAAFSEDSEGDQVAVFTFDEWSNQPGGQHNVPDDKKTDGGSGTLNIRVEPTPQSKPEPGPADRSFSEEQLKAARDEAARETEERVRRELEEKFAEEQAQAAEAARLAANEQFCEELVTARRLKPADKDFHLALLNALSPGLEFGEGKGARPLAAELRERMEHAPEALLFSEITPAGEDGLPPEGGDRNNQQAARAIEAYARAHEMSFSEAYVATAGGTRFEQ